MPQEDKMTDTVVHCSVDDIARVAALAKVLATQPESLELATTGDCQVMVWCKVRRLELDAEGQELCDGGMTKAGGTMAWVSSTNPVHGVSGELPGRQRDE